MTLRTVFFISAPCIDYAGRMALHDVAVATIDRKILTFREDIVGFFVRSILAGAYLTLGTAFAGVIGHAVESLVPGHGLGTIVFGLLFGIGLFAVILLGADLATGNMMYAGYGTFIKKASFSRGAWMVLLTTIFNLLGAIVVAVIVGMSGKMVGFDATHLMATISDGKLIKPIYGLFFEGILANFVVNMAVVGALLAKDIVSKFFVILPLVAIFVVLGLEHVIANFSLFTLTFFSSIFNSAALPDHFTAGAIVINWVVVWLGNFIGGGLLMGGVYAWLHRENNLH